MKLALLWAVIRLVLARPGTNLPINAQVPPIARANRPFTFTFPESTFISSVGSIRYSLENAPSWLVMDGPSRTLKGTPTTSEIGSVVFNLIATDDSGDTSMPVTFVVTADTGPRLGLSVSDQLPAYGAFSMPNNILLAPGSPLAITFSSETFLETGPDTVYYGISANNTPLPSWIRFDPNSLAFKGTTPEAGTAISQTYGIQLTASNVLGFADAIATFQIIVESHLLAFDSAVKIINMTSLTSINDSSIADSITLNGQRLKPTDIKLAKANPPNWLKFDATNLLLSGDVPSDFKSQNFSVSVTDNYGDSATTSIVLQAANYTNKALLNPIGSVNATTGTEFTFNLDRFLNASDLSLSTDLGVASNWLNFSPADKSINGYVPGDLRPQQVIVNITATQGTQSQSEILAIAVQVASASPSPTNDTPLNPATSANQTSSRNLARPWIAAAILAPLIGLVLIILLALFCLRRRRRQSTEKLDDQNVISDAASNVTSIYDPIITEKAGEEKYTTNPDDADRASRPTSVAASKAPRIPVPWERGKMRATAPDRLSITSFLERQDRAEKDRPESWQSWQKFTGFLTNSARPKSKGPSDLDRILERGSSLIAELPDHQVLITPTVPHKSTSRPELSSARHLSTKQRGSSNMSLGSQGRLYSQIMWGFGHGRTEPAGKHDSILAPGRFPGFGNQPSGRFSYLAPGFNRPQHSIRRPKDSQSTSEWTEITSSDIATSYEQERRSTFTGRGFIQRPLNGRSQPTIRPVWPSLGTYRVASATAATTTTGQVQIPKSARLRQSSGNPFLSGRTLERTTRLTRSRSSSLDPPTRPSPEKSKDSYDKSAVRLDSIGWPRVIDVHEGTPPPNPPILDWTGQDPRFESAVPSLRQSYSSWCDMTQESAIIIHATGEHEKPLDYGETTSISPKKVPNLSAIVFASRPDSEQSDMQSHSQTERTESGMVANKPHFPKTINEFQSSSMFGPAAARARVITDPVSTSHGHGHGRGRYLYRSSSSLDDNSLRLVRHGHTEQISQNTNPFNPATNGTINSSTSGNRVLRPYSPSPGPNAHRYSFSSGNLHNPFVNKLKDQYHTAALLRQPQYFRHTATTTSHTMSSTSTADSSAPINIVYSNRAQLPLLLDRDEDPATKSQHGEFKRFVPSITNTTGGRSVDEDVHNIPTMANQRSLLHDRNGATNNEIMRDDDEKREGDKAATAIPLQSHVAPLITNRREGRGRMSSREESPYFL